MTVKGDGTAAAALVNDALDGNGGSFAAED
jgi:hypothetical protein